MNPIYSHAHLSNSVYTKCSLLQCRPHSPFTEIRSLLWQSTNPIHLLIHLYNGRLTTCKIQACMSHEYSSTDHSDASRSVLFNNSTIVYTPQSSSASSSRTRKSARKGILSDSQLDDEEDMDDRRPPFHRPIDGRSHQPLLNKQSDDERERGRPGFGEDTVGIRPTFSRRSTMRSRSPDTQAKMAAKKKYTYAAFFLLLSLISFVIQTETAVYIQHELHWDKAYCML